MLGLKLLATAAALAFASCALLPPDFTAMAREAGVDPATLVVRGGVAYGPRRNASTVEVVAFDGSGSRIVAASTPNAAPDFVAMGTAMISGDVEPCCVVVYGTAGPGVARVEIDTEVPAQGGNVVSGVFLALAPQADLDPASLAWSFLGSDGAVLRTGTGPGND